MMTTTTIPAASVGDSSGIGASRADHFLEALETEIRIRRRELTALEGARDALTEARRAATDLRRAEPREMPAEMPQTVADAVEIVLTERGALHANVLAEELRLRFDMKTTSKNLINILNRWISRGGRFRRPGPNTFALARISQKPNGAARANGVARANGADTHTAAR